MTARTNLLDFTLPRLTVWFGEQGEKPFRAKQVFHWIHQRGVGDFDAMTDLAKSLREKLKEHAEVRAPAILSEQRSADGTVKWLFDVGVGQRHRDRVHPRGRPRHAVRVLAGGLRARLQVLLDGPPGLQPRPRRGRDHRAGVDGEPAAGGARSSTLPSKDARKPRPHTATRSPTS